MKILIACNSRKNGYSKWAKVSYFFKHEKKRKKKRNKKERFTVIPTAVSKQHLDVYNQFFFLKTQELFFALIFLYIPTKNKGHFI